MNNLIDKKLIEYNKSNVFTPENISKIMSSYLLNDGNLLDPAVGTGNLLKFINIDNYNEIDVYDINNDFLDKCITNNKLNKNLKDFIKSDINKKYKNIILNPPFIKIQDLSNEYKTYIKDKWKILKKGNIDLYYVFLLKCLELLDLDGYKLLIIYIEISRKLTLFFDISTTMYL